MLSSSFKNYTDLKQQVRTDSMDLGGNRAAITEASELDRFVYDVESIKEDMRTMEKLHKRLQELNEKSGNIRDSKSMKEMRALMVSEIDHVLILAGAIMKRLGGLERSNTVDRKASGSMSSIDRSRTSVVVGLGKKLRDMMDEFQGLRAKMAGMYKETVEHKFFQLTGEKHYIETIEHLLSTGEIEHFLVEAVEENGRAPVVDFLEEIQERREATKYMQKCLIDLHQIFLQMVSIVEAPPRERTNQNDQQRMPRGASFIMPGAAQLHDSWEDHEKDAKKRATIALIVVVVIMIVLIAPLFLTNQEVENE